MTKDAFAEKRLQMVREQIEARGVGDRGVIEAMRKVPRHVYIPLKLQEDAYSDEAQPIGEGQTVSPPYIVAHMLCELELEPTHRVLEIGTGSGYQTALLAEMVKEVFTIEISPALSKRAKQVLDGQGYTNIHHRVADGADGWSEKAPFDSIIVSAAANRIPRQLVKQLKVGGRMILPMGDDDQILVLLEKNEDGLSSKESIGVRFVPMVGKIAEEES